MYATAAHTSAQRARELASAPPAVAVDRVSKSFKLPHQRYSTLKERALHPFSRSGSEALHGLVDLTFEVKQGEFFGIVGRNGSGKSTLLKCLAGIYGVDAGTIRLDGRVSPFIELGVGFNPDLAARDNVLINAIMLGLSRREARRRFDQIIEFAELEEFVDLKLKNYSSGMSVRLGFSVAIQVDAAVVLVDEVLAVGDAAFQRKCFDEFERLRTKNRTVLFVTHDMNSVERLCDRAMLLERGSILQIGAPEEIGRLYNEVNFGQLPGATDDPALGERKARIRKTWCEDDQGARVLSAPQGRRCFVCVDVEFPERVANVTFSVTFRNEVLHTVFVAQGAHHLAPQQFEAGEGATVRFAFENWLAPARYTLTPSVAAWDPDHRLLDERPDVTSLIVEAPVSTGGVADFPTRVDLERR